MALNKITSALKICSHQLTAVRSILNLLNEQISFNRVWGLPVISRATDQDWVGKNLFLETNDVEPLALPWGRLEDASKLWIRVLRLVLNCSEVNLRVFKWQCEIQTGKLPWGGFKVSVLPPPPSSRLYGQYLRYLWHGYSNNTCHFTASWIGKNSTRKKAELKWKWEHTILFHHKAPQILVKH